MGRDEHRSKNNSRMQQTPKHQIIGDGSDVEFSQEFADQEDHEALARMRAANKRVKKQ